MNTAVIVTKIDPQTKKKAQEAAEELGMPLSIVIKAFLRQFIRTKTVTFSATDEVPNEYLKGVLIQAKKNWEEGKGSPIFTNVEDDLKWLEKQGI